MKVYIGTALFNVGLNQGNELLLNAGVKSVLLLAGVLLVVAVWRRGAAATRHFLLLASLASLLILPAASLLPSIWSGPSRADHFIHQWVGNMAPSGNTLPNVSLVSAKPDASQSAATGRADDHGPLAVATSPSWHVDFRWCVLLVWAAGALVVLLGFVSRSRLLRGIERTAQVLDDPEWLRLVDAVRSELGLKRSVRVLVSSEPLMPMTWGWRRPVVLLSAGAVQWERERFRVVLRHELAHVKRWDCLTQEVANLVRAFYWFNPLVWLAARQMCLERERACDDLVLSAGARPSEYAGHLLEIARQFAYAPRVEAIAMARPSSLERRLRVIVDASHRPSRLRPASAFAILIMVSALALGVGGYKSTAASAENSAEKADALRQQQLVRLQTFFTAKEKQSLELAAKAGETNLLPEFHPYFDAAAKGDWQTVSNIYADFHRRHPQYANSTGDTNLIVSYWQPLLETGLAYKEVASDEARYVQTFIDETINSIPAGSIYFGGTDPGRGLITAFIKSHQDADPFFVLTQNALADSSYLEYLQTMYGGKIYVPSKEESEKCFQEYVSDATRRLDHDTNFPKEPRQIKPSENVYRVKGNVKVSGQVAVMSINGLITKIIFDKNPDREFYIEESFPLDWMYPYLEPHGLILKLNRQKVGTLTNEAVQRDHEYWTRQLQPMIGDWLNSDTSSKELAAFVEKVYVQHDLSGFKGDPRFVQDENACKLFSKLRSSIGGVYKWHIKNAKTPDERASMNKEAEFAFKQAFALCPDNTETVFRYVQFLLPAKVGDPMHRLDEAILIAEAAAHMPSFQGENGQQMRGLVAQLKGFRK